MRRLVRRATVAIYLEETDYDACDERLHVIVPLLPNCWVFTRILGGSWHWVVAEFGNMRASVVPREYLVAAAGLHEQRYKRIRMTISIKVADFTLRHAVSTIPRPMGHNGTGSLLQRWASSYNLLVHVVASSDNADPSTGNRCSD